MQVVLALTVDVLNGNEVEAIADGLNVEERGMEVQFHDAGTAGGLQVEAGSLVLHDVGRVAHVDEAEHRHILVVNVLVGIQEDILAQVGILGIQGLNYVTLVGLLVVGHGDVLVPQRFVAVRGIVTGQLVPAVVFEVLLRSEAQTIPLAFLDAVGNGHDVLGLSLQVFDVLVALLLCVCTSLVVGIGSGHGGG